MSSITPLKFLISSDIECNPFSRFFETHGLASEYAKLLPYLMTKGYLKFG